MDSEKTNRGDWVGYELGREALGSQKRKFDKLDENLRRHLPFENVNARLENAGDEKRGLRCEFNYTIDVSGLLTDHPGVFGVENGNFYEQVIEPLGQLTGREEVRSSLVEYMVCVPGDMF